MPTRLESRSDPPHAAGERETLAGFLDYQRATLLGKVEGLDEEQARRRLVPSQTTLLGIVKHLAYVERWWFQEVFAGLDVEDPCTESDPDADWRIEPDDTVEAIVALYEAEVAVSREIAAGAGLDEIARRPGYDVSLRWILVHMIEETARHNGQADILRELIDGSTGE